MRPHLSKIFLYIVIVLLSVSCDKKNTVDQKLLLQKSEIGSVSASMMDILTSRDREPGYGNNKVVTIAYIDIDNGEMAAYQSKDAYFSGDDLSSLTLSFNPEQASELIKRYKGRYCLIEGVLVYKDSPNYLDRETRYGELLSPRIIHEAEPFRSDDEGSKSIFIKTR
jgi:hypothetical protein